ncbi:ribokinase [Hoyosella rhizosphaerae]|nr:ribokinase [Hoyosella rhizosphaerae]
MSRIGVVGSVNIDLVTTTTRLPLAGETVRGTSYAEIPGGKGANQAKAASHLGGQVWFLGALGTDRFTPVLRESLEVAGVHVPELRQVEGPCGVAAITVDAGGENSVVVVAGANATMTKLSVEDRRRITECDVLLLQLELPIEIVEEAAALAYRSGTVVMLNASPVMELSPDLLATTDVVVVNERESNFFHRELHRVRHVVTTHGADGARYRGPGGGSIDTVPPRVDVVDATGAGDAFVGALAAFWHNGVDTALRWATASGALATTQAGAFAPPLTLVAEYVDHNR